MSKCKCQQISELIERNQFLERQIDNSVSIEDSFEIMNTILNNEDEILKLKGGK